MSESLMVSFPDRLPARRAVSGIDAITALHHFALVTYAVDPDVLRDQLHEDYEPECVTLASGDRVGLISVVPFLDVDFRAAAFPSPRLCCGQTNYRAYIIERRTGRRMVWFFGTVLDSWACVIPRVCWKLPWHRGCIRFDCAWDDAAQRYARYEMTTESSWAPAELSLEDTGEPVRSLNGFADLNEGLLVLTHPLDSAFHRRDGKLGSYSVWHAPLELSVGRCVRARFPLLSDLGLVDMEKQGEPHSVMMQRSTEFTVYLPPTRLS